MSRVGPHAVALAVLITGCGRLGFDSLQSGDAATDALATRTLRLDRVAPGEILENFPLPVTLTGVDPATLRFFDSDGGELAHEIETAVLAWVLVPRIEGTATQLTVQHGGTA